MKQRKTIAQARKDAQPYNNAWAYSAMRVSGYARVFGYAQVSCEEPVFDKAAEPSEPRKEEAMRTSYTILFADGRTEQGFDSPFHALIAVRRDNGAKIDWDKNADGDFVAWDRSGQRPGIIATVCADPARP